MSYPFPFNIDDYPDNMKKSIPLAVKVIDNEGDPEWCFKKNKQLFCSKELHKTLILEYKRRIIINIHHLLKRKSFAQIKKLYMKKCTKQSYSHIKSQPKLLRSLLICLHKKPWKKLKQLEHDFYMISKNEKTTRQEKEATNKTEEIIILYLYLYHPILYDNQYKTQDLQEVQLFSFSLNRPH